MQQLKSGSLLQGGKYKIEKVLGQGGFGITYLAIQELLNRKVAIKEFFYKDYCERDEATSHVTLGTNSNRELVERFMEKFIKEARTISTLNHPHIIRIYDIFKENNTAYYVMEYIEGESLAEMVKQQGALSEDVAVGYIKQVASALEFVHQHSINHLDVKPANIMVRKEERQAVLIDFGLSKQYDASGEQTSTTPVGISHGYAPMEQYNAGGVGTFSPQTDIYSLGATLYKLVTGNTPPQAIEIFNDGLPELSANISSFVVEAIKKAMQPKKAERYNSIKEFVFKLNTKQNERSESVSFDKEETIVIKETQIKTIQDIAAHRKEKKSNYYAIILNVIIIVLAALFIILELSENESLEIKDADSVRIEMRKQQINDSIEMVRREDAEKRRKDSIDVLNEQARLETVRKLEEERKRKELEENHIESQSLHSQKMALELKNIIDFFNSYLKTNTRGWDLFSNFENCNRIAGFEMETEYFPYGAKFEGVLLMNNKTAVKNRFGDAIKWDFILEGARVGADLLILKSAEPYDIYDYLKNEMKAKLISEEKLEYAWLYLYSYGNIYILIHTHGGGSAGNEIEIYLRNDREYMEKVIAAKIRKENAMM